MNRSAVTRFVLSLWVSFLLGESLSAQTVPDRDVSQIRVDGLEAISPETIQRRLSIQPEIFEASHSSVDHATYIYRVREAVARGMLASGFLDSRVEVTDESGRLTLKIHEGPRFRRGTIAVDGASDEVNEWIRSQLLIASTEKEDAIVFGNMSQAIQQLWEPGKPANGTLFGKMHQSHAIQQLLTEIGLRGTEAVVDLIRNEDAKTQDLHIELSVADASFESPTHADADEPVSVSSEKGSSNQPLLDGVSGELQQIHRRLFSAAGSGIRFRDAKQEMTAELIFGRAITVAIYERESHRRNVVIESGEVLISMDQPPAAIRLPIPNASVVLYQQSSEEGEDGKTTRLQIKNSFSSDKPDRPVEMGVVFTQQGWAEWFPPDSTERSEDEKGVTYSHQDHCLRLDHQGRLLELSGTNSHGHRLSFHPVEEDEIRKIADEIIQAAEPIELFVRDSDTDRRVALRDIFRAYAKDDAKDDEFHIPPAGGRRDYYAVCVLSMVNCGKFVEPDSLIGRLSKLYALELSRNRHGLGERMMEIEPAALQGPITSAVVADLWARQGNVERALDRYRHAQQLATDPAAVQHDVRIIVDSNNLLGRVFEYIDVKRWLQQSTQLAAPFDKQDRVAFVQGLVALMPDANTKPDRRNNAQRLLTLYYELHGQTMLEQHLAARIRTLEFRQRRIAEKKKKKEEKKKR